MHNVFNKKVPINITNKFEYKINNYNITPFKRGHYVQNCI